MTTDGSASLRDRLRGVPAQLERRRDELREAVPAVDIGLSAVERDNHIGGFVLAGAIAFRLFVYLLPLFLVVLVAAGAAFSFDPDSPSSIAGSSGVSSYVASTLSDAAETSKRSLWILVPLTVWALLVAGRSAHKVISTAHTSAWQLPPRNTRPHTAAGGMVLASLAVLVGLLTVRHLRNGLLFPVATLLGIAFYGALWLAVSLRLPRAEGTDVRALVPGALLVGLGTQGLYAFNVLYLNRKIEAASEAYGALGVAASSLLWLYLVGRLLVAAPVLNATLFERRAADTPPD